MQMNLCETEAESRTWRQTGDCQGGGAGGRSGVWDQQTQTGAYQMDKGKCARHPEMDRNGREYGGGGDAYVCEPLCYTAETNTTLEISYTSIF